MQPDGGNSRMRVVRNERNRVVRASFFFERMRMVAGAALLAGTVAVQPAAAQADGRQGSRGCTNASLRGTFGFTAQGVTLAGSPVPAPLQGAFASSGVATFDGRGNFALTATSSFNGIVQGPAPVSGTYAVDGDCTYTSRAENGVTFRAAIVDGGDELLILQTTPGVVIAGVARRQAGAHGRGGSRLDAAPRCQAAIARGRYGFLADGVAGPPTVPAEAAGPLKGVGTVVFDQRGAFTLVATRSVNGTLDPEPLTLTGSYAFTDGCSFRMTFDVGFTFTGTVVDGGDELLFVETDPGTTLTVRAARQ
jgi:hypothetical protein